MGLYSEFCFASLIDQFNESNARLATEMMSIFYDDDDDAYVVVVAIDDVDGDGEASFEWIGLILLQFSCSILCDSPHEFQMIWSQFSIYFLSL